MLPLLVLISCRSFILILLLLEAMFVAFLCIYSRTYSLSLSSRPPPLPPSAVILCQGNAPVQLGGLVCTAMRCVLQATMVRAAV